MQQHESACRDSRAEWYADQELHVLVLPEHECLGVHGHMLESGQCC